MKILLRHDVDKLGKRGDVVNVKPGFARNLLFPQGVAMPATPSSVKQFEFERRRLEKEEASRLEKIGKVLDQISKFELTLTEKANEEGHLFGSVNEHTLAKALQEAGFSVSARQIRLDQPIKELGVFQVPVTLEGRHKAEFKLWIVESKERSQAAASAGDEISLDEPRG